MLSATLRLEFVSFEAKLACKKCSSDNQSRFTAEMNLHFPGWEGMNKAGVWVFQEVVVCWNCGFAEFIVPEGELLSLAEGAGA